MNTITMAMNAVSCVRSVRPRLVGHVLLADFQAQGPGTTVSIAGPKRLRTAISDAPITGDVSAFAKAYPTTDVACFRSGRPPV